MSTKEKDEIFAQSEKKKGRSVKIGGIKLIKHGQKKNGHNKEKNRFISLVQQAVNSTKKTETKPTSTQTSQPVKVTTGNIARKALLIGINYDGTGSQLNGCINDSENLKVLLTESKYFNESDITMMNDNQKDNLYPNKANMLNQFNELVKFANANKDKQVKLFVSYSGHGTSVVDKNGDEEDGYDEALCPVDYASAGFIVDDDIKANFVDKLPANVKLLMLVDACHSGTMLDLKYSYLANEKNSYITHAKNAETLCEVVAISGCRDNQTSADAWEFDPHQNKNEAQGAMTASFLACYNEDISYHTLVNKIREWLKGKRYAQVPQLSSGKLVDIESKFILSLFK